MTRRKTRSDLNSSLIPAALVLWIGLMFSGCQTRESMLNSRIEDVEKGLVKAVTIKGTKPDKRPLAERLRFYKVPAVSLAVMDQYKVVWSKAYGVKDVRSAKPATEDTLFQAGGLSQSVSAAAALRFVDQGAIGLDAEVNKALKSWKIPKNEFTEKKKITLRDVLLHSAGFGRQIFPGYAEKDPLPSLRQVLDGEAPAKNLPVAVEAKPGDVVSYSESGFVVLQQLLQDIEGKPFPEIMQNKILGPAGMINSAFEWPLPETLRAKAATGHVREGQPVEGRGLVYPELAAKGLWTTPSDLAGFALELTAEAMGKSTGILSMPSARAMLTAQKGIQGLGFSVVGSLDNVRFYHQGKTKGFSCGLVFYPSTGRGAVIMTNSDNGALLTDEILRAISAAYSWPDYKTEVRPFLRLDASIYRQYVGRYRITPEYELDVKFEDYYLIIQPTGQMPTKFYVENQSTFYSIDPFIRIHFRRDDNGNVDSLVLWQQDFEQAAKKIG